MDSSQKIKCYPGGYVSLLHTKKRFLPLLITVLFTSQLTHGSLWDSLWNFGAQTTASISKKNLAIAASLTGGLYCSYKFYQATQCPKTVDTTNHSFNKIQPNKIETPETIAQACKIIKKASTENCKVSIAGARQSRGNQTASHNACIMIDTKKLNRIISIDTENLLVTVEAGITWKQLENVLHTHGLSTLTRQSYIDFSVGGSIGVNAHGQNIHETMLVDTVQSMKIICADGSLKTASKYENSDLLYAAIGGYGLVGIIAEVTLRITRDCWLEQKAVRMKISEYPQYFLNNVKNNTDVNFHSARLDINPQNLFNELISITYSTTSTEQGELPTLKETHSFTDRLMLHIIRKGTTGKKIRLPIEERMLKRAQPTSRNNALRHSIENLKPLNNTRDCLQEYFVPCDKMQDFLEQLKQLVVTHSINLINVTVRYVKANNNLTLSYARQDCFAFVLYYNIAQEDEAYQNTKAWTQKLIDSVLVLGGTFYLPYELLARNDQVLRAYPNFRRFCCVTKKTWDPQHIFTNDFFEHYKVNRL